MFCTLIAHALSTDDSARYISELYYKYYFRILKMLNLIMA